jgi:hypothetical protein
LNDTKNKQEEEEGRGRTTQRRKLGAEVLVCVTSMSFNIQETIAPQS